MKNSNVPSRNSAPNKTRMVHRVLVLCCLLALPDLAQASEITATAFGGDWSNPFTWLGGVVPGEDDQVTIPGPATVTFDADADADTILVQGTLVCGDVDLNVSFSKMTIDGLFQCGLEGDRYLKNLTITLTGDTPGGNTKSIQVNSGGTLELHGKARIPWGKLWRTAPAGNTFLRIESEFDPVGQRVDWDLNDEIVVASSDFDMNQAEVRVLNAVGPNDYAGKKYRFSPALEFPHFGIDQEYDGGALTLDERAEVGLLTRNIVIEGSASPSPNEGFGGHMMFLAGSTVHINDVRLTNMGQEQALGRYPIHWHQAGNVAGSYFKNSAIVGSNNRCVTIHATNEVLIERNVCYDHVGHGFFLEDGAETRNQFIENLGLVTKGAAVGEGTIPSDETHPSTFWITNPDNDFIGNVAAGSDHGGFWFALPDTPTGGQQGIFPRTTELGTFLNNTGHSSDHSNLAFDGQPKQGTLEIINGTYDPRSIPGDLESPPGETPVVDGFTAYKSRRRNLWLRTKSFRVINARLGDNGRNTFFSYNQIIEDSLIVGKSALTALTTGIPKNNEYIGHGMYDGPSGADNVHFADFDGIDSWVIGHFGASRKSQVHFLRGLTFENVPEAAKVDFGDLWKTGVIDQDGVLTGLPGATIVSDVPASTSTEFFDIQFWYPPGGTCTSRVADWDAWVCDERYGSLRIHPDYEKGPGNEQITIRRSDTLRTMTHGLAANYKFTVPVLADRPQTVVYQFQFPQIPRRALLDYRYVETGEAVVISLPNVPSDYFFFKDDKSTILPTATSLAALQSAAVNTTYRHGTNVYFKLVADEDVTELIDGDGLPYLRAGTAAWLCQAVDCDGVTKTVATVADYEGYLDTRASLVAVGDPDVTAIAYTADPGGDSNHFKMTNNGDGDDDWVDYDLSLGATPQDWRAFATLTLEFALTGSTQRTPGMDVIAVDRFGVETLLGHLDKRHRTIMDVPVPAGLAEVSILKIRIKESFYMNDLFAVGTQRTRLHTITLEP